MGLAPGFIHRMLQRAKGAAERSEQELETRADEVVVQALRWRWQAAASRPHAGPEVEAAERVELEMIVWKNDFEERELEHVTGQKEIGHERQRLAIAVEA